MLNMAGMAEFGALIKRAREQRGLTGVELATRIGRQHSYIVRFERGQASNPPDTRDFHAIARELNLPASRMLEALGYLTYDETANEEAGLDDIHARLDPHLMKLNDRDLQAVLDLASFLASTSPGPSPQESTPPLDHHAPSLAGPSGDDPSRP